MALEIAEGPGGDEELRSLQTRQLVRAALNRPPLPRHAVLVMPELDDVPAVEVAAVLSSPLFTVHSLRNAWRELHAAMRRLVREAGAG